jgi:hypothetical protein
MQQVPDAPRYHYDQSLGDPRDAFTPAADVHPDAHRPEVPATFVAHVEGETIINTMWGRRTVAWHAGPGTQCVILGYWADGTVKLRWPAIEGAYRVEGRFPAWVVAEDPSAKMAGGGHMLLANVLGSRRPSLARRLLRFVSRLGHTSGS